MAVEVPDDALFVYCEYERDVHGTHPETKEPIYPPLGICIMCEPRALGWAKSSLASLNRTRGWLGEITVGEVSRHD